MFYYPGQSAALLCVRSVSPHTSKDNSTVRYVEEVTDQENQVISIELE